MSRSDNRIYLIIQFENNVYHTGRKYKKKHFASYTVSNSYIGFYKENYPGQLLLCFKMDRTDVTFLVLVITAVTVSAQDYNVSITFQETKDCEIDCFEILFKFAKGENFTERESVTWDKPIVGNIHNVTEFVRALHRLVNYEQPTSKQAKNSAVSTTTTRSSERIETQDTRASDQNKSSVPTKSSSSMLSKASTSSGKNAEKSTKTTTVKSATLTAPHKDLSKPLKRSHDAKTGILITLTVVIIIIAGAWVGRKYYLRGTSESYLLLR